MIFNSQVFEVTASVTIYGLPNEKITITPSSGASATSVTIPNSITGSVVASLKPGSYTVSGDLSGVSKVVSVSTSTTTSIRTGQAYFWDGLYVSGSWTNSGYSSDRTLGGSISVGNELQVNSGSSGYVDCVLGTANAQDLTNIKTLYFRISGGANVGSRSKVGVSADKSVTSTDSNTADLKTVQPSAANTTVSIDVSSWSGNGYPFLVTSRAGYGGYSLYVSRVWGVCS